MSGIAAWIFALAGPLALRVLAGLGFSIVAFTGVTQFVTSLLAIAQSNWAALPVSVLQLASLSGVPESMGMIASAYATRMTIWVAVQGTRFVVR